MTTLVVDELITTLSQTVNINNEGRSIIESIRPYILMYNAPTGTFTLSVKFNDVVLDSKSFTSSDIKNDMSTTDDYVHIWKNLEFDPPLLLDKGSYELELSSTGYTFMNSSFIGWIREHENQTNEISGAPISDFYNPRAFQLMERQND